MSKTTLGQFEGGYIVTSDAVCIDPQIGEDLFAYLNGTLTSEHLERFKLHLLDCVSCDVDVGNLTTLAEMLAQ